MWIVKDLGFMTERAFKRRMTACLYVEDIVKQRLADDGNLNPSTEQKRDASKWFVIVQVEVLRDSVALFNREGCVLHVSRTLISNGYDWVDDETKGVG